MKRACLNPLLWRAITSKKTVPDTPTALPRAFWPFWLGGGQGKKRAGFWANPTLPFLSFSFSFDETSERARARACFLD
jgi:hypothetical protein